jgi:hypothetical protein
MEKLKSIIGIISSIIFILGLVLIFSCKEKKTISENKEVKGDTTVTTIVETNSDTNSEYLHKFRDESKELEIKLKALGEQAKQKGGELGKSIKERTNKLDEERKGFYKDSTNRKHKENWTVFKEKTKKVIDSLGRKLDYQ